MKQIILLGIAFLFSSWHFTSVSNTREMTVKEITGDENLYRITELKKMTFSSGNMQVYNNTENDEIALSNIQHIRFSDLLTELERHTKSSISLSLFPNPTKDLLTILIPSNEKLFSTLNIIVVSVDGRVVQTLTHQPTQKQIEIDVTSFLSGLYYIIVNCNGEVISEPFIKL